MVKGSPSEGRLHAGDVIKAVDGTAVTQPDDVAKLVTQHKPGQDVVFTVVPAKGGGDPASGSGKGAERAVTIRTAKAADGRAIVGIQAETEHTFPFRIDIKLADVGGPSAGMMFAWASIDKLTPDQPDRRQVRRRHRHDRRQRHGRPDRRHLAEDRSRPGTPAPSTS